MNHVLFRRAVLNGRMLAVILVVVGIYFQELFINEGFFAVDWSRNENVDILEMHLEVFAWSYFSITAGLFPGIPYGFSLLDERNSGYLKYELSRMPIDRYIRKKLFFTGLSGAFSMLVPYLILMLPISIAGIPATEQFHPFIMEDEIWGSILYVWGGYLVICLKGILIVLFGILWAELSLMISLFVRNRYIAFVLPFIVFELCWLLDPSNGSLRTWNPLYMLRSEFLVTEAPLVKPFVVFTLYILMVSVVCAVTFKRQVKNGKI